MIKSSTFSIIQTLMQVILKCLVKQEGIWIQEEEGEAR